MEQESKAVGESKMNGGSLASLLKQIGEGDRSALLVLYDRTSRLLFGIVLKILGDRAAAEEALLDVYTHIWSQSAAYHPELFTPLEWLATAARARAIARLHGSKRDKRRQKPLAEGTDPSMTVAPGQQKAARSCMASLVPAQQEILEWAYYSGLSCVEIATQIGKPLGAVRTHARLALSRLEDAFRVGPEQKNTSISGEP